MSFGYYHKVTLFIGCLIGLANGCLITVGPFATRFIQQEYNLSFFQTSILSMCSTVGGILGAVFFGIIVPVLGRKRVIVLGLLFGAFIGIFFFYSNSFLAFCGCYVSNGMLIMTLNSSYLIYLTENITGDHKGKIMAVFISFASIGKILGATILWLGLSEYQCGYWKIPFMITSLIFAGLLAPFLFFTRESIKFSFAKGNIRQAHQDFHHIQRLNHRESFLHRNKMVFTIQEFLQLSDTKSQKRALNKSQLKNTMSYNWSVFFFFLLLTFLISSMGFLMLAVPYILGTESSVLLANLVIVSGELMGSLLQVLFIDNPKIGRKKLIIISQSFFCVLFIFPLFFDHFYVYLIFYLGTIFSKISIATALIHLSESFSIEKRAAAIAKVETLMCLSLFFMPVLFFNTLKIDTFFIYILIFVFLVFGLISSLFVPSDLHEEKVEKNKNCT